MVVEGDEGAAISGRPCRWTDLSVLILSLLLAATVATVVYMAVRPPATTCNEAPLSVSGPQAEGSSTEVDVELEIDGEKTAQKIAYNEDRNIAYFYDKDGSFTAEDFDKGWVITNIGKTDDCVVIPTGNNQNRTYVNSIISSYTNGGVVQGKKGGSNVHAQVLPGSIEDTSMFSEETNAKCQGGYMWLTTVDLDDEDTFKVEERKKRAIRGCYCAVPVFYEYIDVFGLTERINFEVCLRWCYTSRCNKRHLCSRYPGTFWFNSVSNQG